MVWPGTIPFVKQVAKEWSHDDLGNTAAALAFYSMLALFPFLLCLVTFGGLILNPQSISLLLAEVSRVAPPAVTQIVGDRLLALQRSASGKLLTLGIAGALWGASGGVTALMEALNRCYDVVETRPFWKTRALALGVTLGGGGVAILATAIALLVPAIGHWVGGPVGALVTWLRFPVAGFLMMLLLAFLYWLLPSGRPKFHVISVGSVVSVVLWLAGSWGFSEYLRHSRAYEATYGALGGVIVLLVWIWLSSLVILLGAELNKILTPAEARAGKREPPPVGTSAPEPTPA